MCIDCHAGSQHPPRVCIDCASCLRQGEAKVCWPTNGRVGRRSGAPAAHTRKDIISAVLPQNCSKSSEHPSSHECVCGRACLSHSITAAAGAYRWMAPEQGIPRPTFDCGLLSLRCLIEVYLFRFEPHLLSLCAYIHNTALAREVRA